MEDVLSADSSLRLLDVQSELESLRAGGELAADFSADSVVRGPYLRTIPGIQPTDGFFRGDAQEDGLTRCHLPGHTQST